MEKYTIYCTHEQTHKAIELGAPIIGKIAVVIPTAEQMISWLEEKNIYIHIDPCSKTTCSWYISSWGYNDFGYVSHISTCNSREEATLTAIDASLDYLSNNKK